MSGLGFDDDIDTVNTAHHSTGVGSSSHVAGGAAAAGSSAAADPLAADGGIAAMLEAGGTMLGFTSVLDVCKFSSSHELAEVIREIQRYQTEEDNGGEPKNSIVKDDPEHKVLMDCAKAVWRLEGEKSLAHRFIVDHYSLRLPELAMLIPSDAVIYAKAVQLIGNAVDDLTPVIDALDALIPSQISSIVIAVCCTTRGVPLDAARLAAVLKACEHVAFVEGLKQIFLDYIQQRMPLVAPNVCAFLGAALTSQIFTMCESLERLSQMDQSELIELGSHRRDRAGVRVHTAGFLSNCDLVLIHPPEIRTKALRLVAPQVLELARVDDNRRAPDDSQGVKAREDVRMKMIRWSDPLLQRGAANNTYERLSKGARERRARMAQTQKQQQQDVREFRNSRFNGGRGGGFNRQRFVHHGGGQQ